MNQYLPLHTKHFIHINTFLSHENKDEFRHSKLYQELSDEMLKPVVGGLDQSVNSKKGNKQTKPVESTVNEIEDEKDSLYFPNCHNTKSSFDGDWGTDFA